MRIAQQVQAFDEPVRTFVAALLDRHPEWAPYLATCAEARGRTRGECVYLELPSPAHVDLPLWAEVMPGEATVGLGWRAAEQCFAWSEREHGPAFAEVIAFIDRVAAGDVVLASVRERFLWRVEEKGRFRAAPILQTLPLWTRRRLVLTSECSSEYSTVIGSLPYL
jgi:hypothetical protein